MKKDFFMAKALAKKHKITFKEAYRKVKIWSYHNTKESVK